MASYGDTWNLQAQIAAESQWVSTGEILEMKDNLAAIKFALQQERNKGLDFLQKLVKRRNIAARGSQFPDDQSYVCLQGGDWPGKFEQLRMALNYKPPENSFVGGNRNDEKHMHSKKYNSGDNDKDGGDSHKYEDSSKIQDLSERQKFEKSMLAYYTAIESIENQIGSRSGVYNRDHFEHHFYLKWATA
jgi:hypothetical protein